MKNCNWKFAILLAVIAGTMLSCFKEDGDPISGSSDVSPSAVIADPEGTIELKMRNYDNGRTYLDNFLYITSANNFKGGQISMLGAVNGLGNVARIPSSGWANEVAVKPGNGYVVYYSGKFYRLYVVDFTLAAESEGIIGASIKYQSPFYGLDEKPLLEKNEVEFPAEGGNVPIKLKNTSIIPVEIESSESWCSASLDLFDGSLKVSCKSSNTMEERTATITLTTHTEKTTEITVKQAPMPVSGSLQPLDWIVKEGFPCQSLNAYQAFEVSSNIEVSALSVSANKDWCKPTLEGRYVYVTLDPNKTADDRTAEITLKAGSEVLATAKIKQYKGYIQLDRYAYDVYASSGSVGLGVSFEPFAASEIKVEYDSGFVTWVTDIQSYGSYSYVEVYYNANTTEQPRSTQVKFIAGDSGLSATLVINQEGAHLNVPKTTVLFDKNQGNHTYYINSNADWTAECSESWCTTSRNGNDLTIRVEPTTVNRKATIRFPGFSATISVDQSKWGVGDNYNEGGVTGTVLYTDDNIRLLYKKVGSAKWSTEKVSIGASSATDGEANMAIVKAISGWKTLYPAFALCDALNTNGVTGWYLPAYEEGGVRLSYNQIAGQVFDYYGWSSSEGNSEYAVNMGANWMKKSENQTVIAVRKF